MKCIITANLIPIVLETRLVDDAVVTGDLEELLKTIPHEEILSVLSTTSCFAPREPDDIEKISKICKENGIPHIINNAYGLQCSKICHSINEAIRLGRVDAIVQSTDKNFLVPVGGAIIASKNKAFLNIINSLYPGRASISPILDLFITFLSMGQTGYISLLNQRKEMIEVFRKKFEDVASKHGQRILKIKNTISFAVTCANKELGAKLFVRRVSGTRFVGNAEKEVCGITFLTYGASFSGYPFAYLTAACAIGLTVEEMETFFYKLDKLFCND